MVISTRRSLWGRKNFCNGIVPLTPLENDAAEDENISNSGQVEEVSAPKDPITIPSSINVDESLQNPSLLDIGASADIQQFLKDNDCHLETEEKLVRRNSLSCRTPPPGSIAAEILGSPSFPIRGTLDKTKSLLSDLRQMSEQLSEFGSCVSSSSSSEQSGNESEDKEYKTMNDKKRGWKKKRKLSITPNKDSFVKKQK